MHLQYSLDIDDYLQYQLFIASRSPRVIKSRNRDRYLFPLFMIFFGCIAALIDRSMSAIFSPIVIALIWWSLYPIWQMKRYRQHYEGFIIEKYKDLFHKINTVELTDEQIIISQNEMISIIPFKELKEINELPKAFYLYMGAGQSIIIPKKMDVDTEKVKLYLQQNCKKFNLSYHTFPHWKWK